MILLFETHFLGFFGSDRRSGNANVCFMFVWFKVVSYQIQILMSDLKAVQRVSNWSSICFKWSAHSCSFLVDKKVFCILLFSVPALNQLESCFYLCTPIRIISFSEEYSRFILSWLSCWKLEPCASSLMLSSSSLL